MHPFMLALELHPHCLLSTRYRPKFWFWETFETVKRLAFTGALLVFGSGTVGQLFVGMWLSVFSIMACKCTDKNCVCFVLDGVV